ncbi:MAG: GMC oxidoreductase [bacterium]
MELTKQEKRLSTLLLILTGLFTLALIANVLIPLIVKPAREFLQGHLPFVANSAIKMSALALLAFNGFINVRRNFEMIKILVWIHLISILVLVSFALFAEAAPDMRTMLWLGLAMDGGIGAVILVFFVLANRSLSAIQPAKGFDALKKFAADTRGFIRFKPQHFSLSDIQTDALANLIDAVIPAPAERKVSPERLIERFEEFISVVDSAPRDAIKTALEIIAPFLTIIGLKSDTITREATREKMKEALEGEDQRKRNAARLLHIMITYLYYSDLAVDSQVGYVRFKKRDLPQAGIATGRSKFSVYNAIPKTEYDVCIVGSGVAGSILANRLAKKGKSVLVLEAGRYYPEGAVIDDEFLMLAHLYKTDIFGSALGGSFPVIQAQCVGGGAVVNNAVCFRLPGWVKKGWDDFGAQLDDAKLKAAFDIFADELHIRPADEVVRRNGRLQLNPSRDFFLRGIERLGIPHGAGDPNEFKEGFYTVPVNIGDCLGCGYCNLGCAYERKENNLKHYLPDAVRTGHCDVVMQAKVDSVATDFIGNGHLKADYLRVELANGDHVKVKAKKYILSAGAIASSAILLKSFKIRLLGTPIGERFSANAGSPLHARFNEVVHAYAGLQISDYLLEKNGDGSWDWLAEIWFNPPATQAQGIPGHLNTHFERMKKYPNYAAIGPLVGTEAVGKIELNILNQPEANLKLPPSDMKKLKAAIKRCSEIYLESGAEEILLMTRNEMSLKSKADLKRIDREIKKHDDFLVLSTGHPMGGNAMSDDKDRGVVSTNFEVHGVEDLFVCDASVFPTSVKVNPQWTIMALAELCSEEILRQV